MARELVGDPLRDQRGVELGLLDLLDVQLHVGVLRDAGKLPAETVCLGTTTADDDAGPRCINVYTKAVTRPLDLDAADGGSFELTHQIVADLPVLDDGVLVIAVVEPAGLPVRRDSESEPVRVDLLAHYSLSLVELSSDSSVATSDSDASSAS